MKTKELVSIVKQWFNEEEALLYTGIKSRTSLLEARKSGELNSYNPQGRLLYKKEDLDKWIESHKIENNRIELQFHRKNKYV